MIDSMGKHFIFGAVCILVMAPFTQTAAQGLVAPTGQARADQARRFEASEPGVGPQFRTRATDVAPIPSTPGDDDLGEQWILKEKEKYEAFRIFGDTTLLYTSNAALSRTNELSDALFVGQVGASWVPKITDRLQAEVTVRQSFFRYGEFDVLDFNSLNAGAGMTYVMPRLWDIAVFARYNYNWLTDTDGNEIFHNNTLTIGLQKAFVLTRSHYFYVGYFSEFGWADPEVAERDEHTLYGGYHLDITRSLAADIGGTAAIYDYSEVDRTDLNLGLNFSLRWEIVKNVSLVGSASFATNISDRSVFDYDVLNAGGGLAVSFKF